ncbi:isopentenyl-diphosphate Delta-isomerase [Patescibacteria group bacterium]|nr:isopentenyl-diphosphate Delta-isomerase [Patescibacteria group bacterium]
MPREKVILVDEKDREIGFEEKLKAHQKGGKLHRCVSIFIFNSKGELLIQKRAEKKYHSGDLWTNTCCGHPKPGEILKEAAQRRLKEEMGLDSNLKEKFSFIYKAEFENGLCEWEFDHIFFGKSDQKPKPAEEEVSEWKWIDIEKLKKDIKENPKKYTFWFKIALKRVSKYT